MMTGADNATQVANISTFTDSMTPVPTSPDLPSDSGYVDTGHTRGAGPPCCAGCSQPILDQFILQVQGHVWHASCLRCSVCNILLSHVCYSGNSQLYCQDDFFRLYGASCSSCTGDIAPTNLVRRAHDNVYHTDCFHCRVCQHELRTGDEFYLCVDGQLLCKMDYLTINVEGQCQDEDTDSTNDASNYGVDRDKLCAQNSNTRSDIVEKIVLEVGVAPSELCSWFRQQRAKTRRKGSSSLDDTENPSSLTTSRVVAPPGGYPLPIVNRGASPGRLPEGTSRRLMPAQNPDLAPENRTHWTGWEDLWSNEFVPPNVDLEPENISDGEVVGFSRQAPIVNIPPPELQASLYL